MHKWEILGYVAAIFDPLPTGLLAGYFLYKERRFKKTGRIVAGISILWFALIVLFSYVVAV